MATKSIGRKSGPKNGQKRIQKNSKPLQERATIVEELGTLPPVVLPKEEVKASQRASLEAKPRAEAKARQKDPPKAKERPRAKARGKERALTEVSHALV